MIVRTILGVMMLSYTVYLSYRVYRLVRYNDWSSPFLALKRDNMSRSQRLAFGLISLPFVIFFCLLAVDILFKIEILSRILRFL